MPFHTYYQITMLASSYTTGKKPMLITHGWPGSVWEFYKLIPRLTEPERFGGKQEDALEVICPSIPGYGFSEAPHHTGLSLKFAP